jgi:hypothetical protein
MQVIDAATGLCRIPFSSIKPAKEFDEFEFAFFNPRVLENKNRESYGFSQEEIEQLKNSIKSKGLMENLHVNQINGECVLVDGHRRHEAISQLLQENVLCYDRHANQNVPAKDLYDSIIVTIHHGLNASQCFSRAFESDSNKISFGENATIRFVDYCSNFNMPEHKIVEMCGKTVSWLRYTVKLLHKVNQDEEIKSALLEGRINAAAANSLMDIEDEAERQRIFQTALQKAEQDFENKIKKQDQAIYNSKKKLKKAEKIKEEAEEYGDIDDVSTADDLISKHASALEERKRERSEITPRINNKNIDEAIGDVDADYITTGNDAEEEPIKPDTPTKKKTPKLSMKSIRDTWVKSIDETIARGHMTDEHETVIPILNNCFADMIKAMFDEKIAYQDFIYRWATRFAEAGLSANAGGDIDINDEIG